jgi:ribosome-binding protein aMBF1 (putative translation factor)
MKSKRILEVINQNTSKESSKWMEKAHERKVNQDWLNKSAKIAIRILSEIRNQKISQKLLAEQLGVSAQYVNKIVKGQENLSIETISKIEKVLGIVLIEIPSFETNGLDTKEHNTPAKKNTPKPARSKSY